MFNIRETMEGLGYTNICGEEGFQLQVGTEIDMEKGSPLYNKIEQFYGDRTMETFLLVSDCYGDDKDGNQVLLYQITDEYGNLFFAGSKEEYDKVSTK